MFKTTIALILLAGIASGTQMQRGKCAMGQGGQRATPRNAACEQPTKPENPCVNAQDQERRRGSQARRGGKARRGQGQARGQAKGLGQRALARKAQGNARGNCCKQAVPRSDASRRHRQVANEQPARRTQGKANRRQGKRRGPKATPGAQRAVENTANRRGQRARRCCNGRQADLLEPQVVKQLALQVEDAPAVTPAKARTWVLRLQPVLEAELYAQEYYEAAAAALNGFRRFENLARAEGNHASAIANAITGLGGTPKWNQPTAIVVPQTIAEADGHCEVIELHVIQIYEGLITDAPTTQLQGIFQNIQDANYRHLNAVQ